MARHFIHLALLLITFIESSRCTAETPVLHSLHQELKHEATIKTPNDEIVSWLSQQSEFFIHSNLSFQGGNIFADDTIAEGELLMVIPSAAILSTSFPAERHLSEDDESQDDDSDSDSDSDSSDEDQEDPICQLFEILLHEIQLGNESRYFPYIDHLQEQYQIADAPDHEEGSFHTVPMPSSWSHPGRRLISMLSNVSAQENFGGLLAQYVHCIFDESTEEGSFNLMLDLRLDAVEYEDNSDDDEDNSDDEDTGDEDHSVEKEKDHGDEDQTHEKDDMEVVETETEELLKEPPSIFPYDFSTLAYVLSAQEQLWKRALELTIGNQIDRRFMIPLYGMIPHHHFDYNVVHEHVKGEYSIRVIATRPLKPGDVLTRPSQSCLKNFHDQKENVEKGHKMSWGEETMIGAMQMFGQVQRYPHYWDFKTGLSFVYDGGGDIDGLPSSDSVQSIEWVEGPTEKWQLDYLEEEVSRQLKLYEIEVIKSNDTVPVAEWNQANRYSYAIQSALSLAVKEGRNLLNEKSKVLSRNDKEETKEVTASEQDYLTTFDKAKPSSITSVFLNASDTAKEDDSDDDDDSDDKDDECDPLKDCEFDDIEYMRGCKKLQHIPSTARNASEWHLMRKSYVDAVGPEKASIKAISGSGIRVPYKIAHSPARGRGVFATADVPKGSLIWTTQFTAWFDEGDQFRRFLAPLPDDMVCDLLLWCYTCGIEPNVNIGCDLDEGSFFNSCDNRAEFNIGNVHVPNLEMLVSWNSPMYAMRDIPAGEEFVASYGEFDSDNYAALGL